MKTRRIGRREAMAAMGAAGAGIFADSLFSEIVAPTGSPTSGSSVAFRVGI